MFFFFSLFDFCIQISGESLAKSLTNQRISSNKLDCASSGTKETPLMQRAALKRSLGPINQVCPQCGRSFGIKSFDRHVEWCREKAKFTSPTMSAQQHLAKERMQARTKYKAPNLR